MPLRRSSLSAVAVVLFGAAPALAAPPIQEHTCPNGLTVLVAEDHALPLVTVEIAAKNGSMTEPPEYNGLSHLYEHMFFKANKALPNQEAYLGRARELGMSWNGTTNTERVNYFFTTTTDHFDDAMVFMRDAIVSPLFDEKELAREREVVVGEIDRNLSSPHYHFWHEVTEHLFFKYPSRKNPLGDAKTVRSATPAMMRTIQERYYVPNNSALVVTGDVKASAVFARADALFAGWAKGPDPFVKYKLVTHPALPKSEVVVVEQPVGTFSGDVTWQGPSTVGKDVDLTYAADLLGTALGEPSSRFQKALVDSGACVRAHFNWSTQRNVGPVSLSFEAAPDKIDACVAAVFAELPKIKEASYFSDEDMANAAHSIEIGLIQERERPSSFAHSITFWWTSAGLDYYRGYLDHVKHVSRADIARFLDGYVLKKPFVFGAMLSPEMIQKGLGRNHFESLAGLPATKEKEKEKEKPKPKAETPKPKAKPAGKGGK